MRYAETDQMGVVHHAAYVPWLEQGRVDWLEHLDLRYSELEKSGVLFPVTDISISYRRPLRFGEVVEVETWLTQLASRKLTFTYRVYGNGDRRVRASGLTVHVPQDRSGLARRLPDQIFDLLAGAAEIET